MAQTMQEIEDTLMYSADNYELLHIRFGPGYLDVQSKLVVEAWEQIKKVVGLIQMGVEDPKDHRAEAYLLMIFREQYYHGYTPKRTGD